MKTITTSNDCSHRFTQKCNNYCLWHCSRSLVVKNHLPNTTVTTFFKNCLFSDTLNQIRCVCQQRYQKNCVLSEGSLSILIKIHAIIFETDLLRGSSNHACDSQMPMYMSESLAELVEMQALESNPNPPNWNLWGWAPGILFFSFLMCSIVFHTLSS